MAPKKMRPDVRIGGGGTVYTVEPLTKRARAWISENVQAEAWQWLGNALCVEHRYIENLVEGMQEDGLTVAGVA